MVNETPWLTQIHPFVRVKGRDQTAAQLLQTAGDALPIQPHTPPPNASSLDDYAQIDPALTVSRPAEQADDPFVDAPPVRLGYAGYSPVQRYRLLHWLRHPLDDGPNAFQQLFIAHLECALFDAPQRDDARHLLHELAKQPHWRSERLDRALLLAHWLAQDARGLTGWLTRAEALPTPLFDLALGQLALLEQPLGADLLQAATQRWLPAAAGKAAASTQRLASLRSAVEGEPLAWALQQSQAAENEPSVALLVQPWRCTHRDLRFSLPQPALRPALEPALREVLSIRAPLPTSLANAPGSPSPGNPSPGSPSPGSTSAGSTSAGSTLKDTSTDDEQPTDQEWLLVLEFSQSRSDYFEYVLTQARKRPGFAQLMDEKRQLVYRVVYRKREMRYFWQLWEYAQNWSSTRVYLHGRELKKWQLWRYSPDLR